MEKIIKEVAKTTIKVAAGAAVALGVWIGGKIPKKVTHKIDRKNIITAMKAKNIVRAFVNKIDKKANVMSLMDVERKIPFTVSGVTDDVKEGDIIDIHD